MTRTRHSIRLLALLLMAALTAACAPKPNDLNQPPPPLGRFLLGLNIVVAGNAMEGPVSRTATPKEWETALKNAVKARFGRYDGDTYYDMAINVVGYALAPPGIPIILSPHSILIVEVRIFYDSKQEQLNAHPKRFIVFEGTSPQTIIGSGLVRTKAQQMHILAYNTAKDIQDWLLKHPEWFPKKGNPVPQGGAKPAKAAKQAPAGKQGAAPAATQAKAPASAAPVAKSKIAPAVTRRPRRAPWAPSPADHVFDPNAIMVTTIPGSAK